MAWNNRKLIAYPSGIPTPDFLIYLNGLSGGSGGGGTTYDLNTSAFLTGGGNLGLNSLTLDLADTTVTAGTYGDETHIPQITVNKKGLVTSVSTIALSSVLPDIGTAGTYGTTTKIPRITTDAKGRVTSVVEQDVTITLPDIGAAGTYGSATKVPQFTIDAKGRVTGVTEVVINYPIPASGVTAGTYGSGSSVPVLTIGADGRVTSASTATQTIPNSGVTAGTYGSSTQAPVIAIGADGRVTSASNAAIPQYTHPTSGITAGTYGDAGNVPVINVDANGHVKSATPTPIALSASTTYSVGGLSIGGATVGSNVSATIGNTEAKTAKTVANGGTGSYTINLSKEAAAYEAAISYSTNGSLRAKVGLLGDDNFGIKVTPDGGTTTFNALSIDNTTGWTKVLGITYPSLNALSGSNILAKMGTSSFMWSPFMNQSWGNNLFTGIGAGSTTLSTTVASGYYWEGSNNVGYGFYTLPACTTAFENTAIGSYALNANTTGFKNTAIGKDALKALTTGTFNTAIGMQALYYNQDGTTNTTFTNCAGVGFDTRVSGSNQVQLGNSSTTTYAYGAVQARSDARDKADVQDTVLGLDFINALRPVDYKWDMRDDYFEEVVETDEAGNSYNVLKPIPKDGSKKRHRFHHGVIAQEVKSTCEALGVDFGGYQDHLISGGNDVKSIGYEEFIAPLIKAVQELSARVKELESK